MLGDLTEYFYQRDNTTVVIDETMGNSLLENSQDDLDNENFWILHEMCVISQRRKSKRAYSVLYTTWRLPRTRFFFRNPKNAVLNKQINAQINRIL